MCAAGLATPLESLVVGALMALPLAAACAAGCGSVALAFGCALAFDGLRAMGHCNVEVFPSKPFRALPALRYLIYTPTYVPLLPPSLDLLPVHVISAVSFFTVRMHAHDLILPPFGEMGATAGRPSLEPANAREGRISIDGDCIRCVRAPQPHAAAMHTGRCHELADTHVQPLKR